MRLKKQIAAPYPKPFAPRKTTAPSEADVERKHRRIAKAAGWFVDKIMKTALNAFPDRFYANGGPGHRCEHCGRGRIVLIEWKRDGKEPGEQQLLRHKQLREAGVEVHVVDNIEDANQILHLQDAYRRDEDTGAVEASVSKRRNSRRMENRRADRVRR